MEFIKSVMFPETKICSTCNVAKPAIEFHVRNKEKGWLFSQCRSCVNETRRKLRENLEWRERENRSKRSENLTEEQRESKREYTRQYNKKHPLTEEQRARKNELRKARRLANPDKTALEARQGREKYKATRTALQREREARKIHATPVWLTPEHRESIKLLYQEAARKTLDTGVEHHVDHIVPLKGEKVCGLHVPWNLRVITAMENMQKHNKLEDHDGDF